MESFMRELAEFVEFGVGFLILWIGFCVCLYGPMLLLDAIWDMF